jgi:uncharacterized membrane protein YcaP (DUF421 family)
VDIVLRAALAYLFILFLTRVVGRRELNTLQPFDLILLIVLGDLIQQGVTQNDMSVTGIVLATGTIGVLTVLFSYVSFRWRASRPLLEGEPLILVENGDPIERNLRRQRITLEELAAEARMHEIETIGDVKWAVLETSGHISFIRKPG